MTEPEQDESAEPEMAGAEEPAARGFGSQLLERAKKAKEQAENVERVLAEQADKKLTVLLIRSLYQAWQVQKKIVVVGLKPTSISVEIGLIPSVSVSFE